jgi:hypothetical protein
MNQRLFILFCMVIACNTHRNTQQQTSNQFPVVREKVNSLPGKNNFYIFLLAGQSNMAGRGLVQPQDTIASTRVLVLNKDQQWEYAKEPLHYYEPTRTGLDCGLSFGKKLASFYDRSITIGLVPCAVGGSSIEQWLGDSTYRNVKLYSNLLKNLRTAMQHGTIKGILWHQGESNAGVNSYKNYRQKLEQLFTRIRADAGDPDLPVYAGQLALFLSRKSNPNADKVNDDLQALSATMKNVCVINTTDLTPLKDSIHFDSRSQRIMGERFAEAARKK